MQLRSQLRFLTSEKTNTLSRNFGQQSSSNAYLHPCGMDRQTNPTLLYNDKSCEVKYFKGELPQQIIIGVTRDSQSSCIWQKSGQAISPSDSAVRR